jgi:hypothetical protein
VHSVARVVSILHVLGRLGAAGGTEIAAEAGVHESTVVPAGRGRDTPVPASDGGGESARTDGAPDPRSWVKSRQVHSVTWRPRRTGLIPSDELGRIRLR